MAETLVLSPHTVEDHVKSLYEKLGVASRQELVARVFLDEYLPEVVRADAADVARALRPRIARRRELPPLHASLRTSVAALWLSAPVRERMAACRWRRA